LNGFGSDLPSKPMLDFNPSEVRGRPRVLLRKQLDFVAGDRLALFAKNADHDLCMAAAANYNNCIHVLPGLQKNLRESGSLAIHVPLQ